MKMPTIGLLTTISCLLFASQVPADPMTPQSGYSHSLDRKTEGNVTTVCPEDFRETSDNMDVSTFCGEVKQLDKESCEDMAETTYRRNKLFYDQYDAYASIVTYRHITFLPSSEEADRAGLTLYKLTDMTSVCRKRSNGGLDDSDAASASAVQYRN